VPLVGGRSLGSPVSFRRMPISRRPLNRQRVVYKNNDNMVICKPSRSSGESL
jgi:hypothetical protein